MSEAKINITTFLTLPLVEQVGDDESCGAWYDWFCTRKSLVNKGKALVSKLKSISKSTKFNPDTTYVFFKNNCPMIGNLYDDFRICDIETGNVLFTIVPKSGHKSMKGFGEVWGRNKDGSFTEQFTGTWPEIKAWFNK